MNYFGIGKEEDEKKNQEEPEEEVKEENKEEEKKDVEDEGPQINARDVPPIITGLQRKRPKFAPEQMREMTQMRRWDVKIANISLENVYSETYDPFVEFVVGGDFRIVYKPGKGGKKQHAYVGKLGESSKTEVIQNIQKGEKKNYQMRFRCEYIGSYFDLQEQTLRIDLWDWERWGINNFLSRLEIPLNHVAEGDINQSLRFLKKVRKIQRPMAKFDFKIQFQEIWDFWLQFQNWSASEIFDHEDEKSKTVNAQIKIRLISHMVISPRVTSEVVNTENNPVWANIEGGINYRGTVNDLENQMIEVILIDSQDLGLNKIVLGRKTTTLKGIVEQGSIRTEINTSPKKSLKKHLAVVKGRINIATHPKYRQTGEITALKANQSYLAILVHRVDKVVTPDDRGSVNTFVTVEWGGLQKKTKTIFRQYQPIYDELFYFPIVITEKENRSSKARKAAIMNELKLQTNVRINIWAQDLEMSNDNIGFASFYLYELKNGTVEEKEFYDEDARKEVACKARVWSGKKRLTSAFVVEGVDSNLFLDAWIVCPNEGELDYEELPQDEGDDMPDFDWEELNTMWTKKKNFLQDSFPDESFRSFRVFEKDEYGKKRFIPTALVKLNCPNVHYKPKDKAVTYLPVKHLPEIARFVSAFPFSSEARQDIWTSTDFFIAMKKGDIEEHATLLASLFMGVDKERLGDPEPNVPKSTFKFKVKKKKGIEEGVQNQDSMERRTFICIGTTKKKSNRHIWVMHIWKDYETVSFWESTTGQEFVLEKRVMWKDKLRTFLNDSEVVHNALVYPEESEEDESSSSSKSSKSRSESDMYDEEEEREDDEDEEEDEVGDDPEDMLIGKEEEVKVTLKDLDSRFKGFNLRNVGVKKEDKNALNNANDQFQSEEKKQANFIDVKVAREEAEGNEYKLKVQVPVAFERSGPKLPFKTLDVIFDNRNAYMNTQHHDPTKIYYDIEDDGCWYPYIPKWNRKFNSSEAKGKTLTMPSEKFLIQKLQTKIFKEVKSTINTVRSGNNQITTWKANTDAVIELMEKHLIFLEMVQRGEYEEREIVEKKKKWALRMRQFMPMKYRFSALPSYFNYSEPDRISTVLTDEAGDFIKMKHKKSKFALAVKVFPYYNTINVVRIMLACFYPIPIEDDFAK